MAKIIDIFGNDTTSLAGGAPDASRRRLGLWFTDEHRFDEGRPSHLHSASARPSTVNGRPVADLVPIHRRQPFVPRHVVEALRALPVDEDLWDEIRRTRAEDTDEDHWERWSQ